MAHLIYQATTAHTPRYDAYDRARRNVTKGASQPWTSTVHTNIEETCHFPRTILRRCGVRSNARTIPTTPTARV